jgi:pimeloyl-ACP methyl ester carboxylesterase
MRTRTNLLSLGLGLAAAGAGAAAGVAAERLAVGRTLERHVPGTTEVPLGSIRELPVVVAADDGTALHVEVDEPTEPDPDGLTVVFSHGYGLNLDSWHFQRLALRGQVRTVWWDQRGHGRSARGPVGSATIDQGGSDLAHVIEATAPTGPLVLVGHSMGGMTVMALAAHHPQILTERTAGVAFIATSAGGLSQASFGLDRLGTLIHKLGPGTLNLLARRPRWVEMTRQIGSDLEEVLVKRWSYASEVDGDLVDFTARMIAGTKIEVIGDFFPAFGSHDKREALAAIRGREVLVLAGDSDLMIPFDHGEEIARLLPGAELAIVREAGHLVMLEHPDLVTPHLVALIHRARRSLQEEVHPGERVAVEVESRDRRPRQRSAVLRRPSLRRTRRTGA